MSRDQINIRCDREMKIFLLNIGDYSQYIRNLINNDRLARSDPKFINSKIEEHKQEIQRLQDLKKQKSFDRDKINELFIHHAPNYKRNAATRSDTQRCDWIERVLKPQLKKLGFKGSIEEIDEILLNWPIKND